MRNVPRASGDPFGFEQVVIDGKPQKHYYKIENGVGYFDEKDPDAGFAMYGFIDKGRAELMAVAPMMLADVANLISALSIDWYFDKLPEGMQAKIEGIYDDYIFPFEHLITYSEK